MKHQYTTESFTKKSLQLFTDFFVDIYAKLFIRKNKKGENPEPKNILFVSLGHLGDVLLLSYVFPFIHEHYPKSNIDVLTGEWCKQILENNPHVRNIISYNHFKQNRANKNLWEKILEQRRTSKDAIKFIKSQNYDLSIEGRISHPNGNLLCFRGKIKRKIGFGSGGFGSLLTNEVMLPPKRNFHMLEAILEELKEIGIEKKLSSIIPYFITSNKVTEFNHPLRGFFHEPFIILHIETGKNDKFQRTMSKEFWLKMVQLILNSVNIKIIVCGTLSKSLELFDYLISKINIENEQIINAVQKLSLDEFFILSKYSKAAITVDSLAAHMCAINCKTMSFYKNCIGTLFFPISNKPSIVIHNNLLSKEARIKTNIINYYFKDLESEEIFKISGNFINSLINLT